MATQRQIDSARRNGALSKGPVTVAGKEKSARNSFTHGLTSKKIFVLENESAQAFDHVVAGFISHYRPATDVEQELCLNVAHAHWRIRRLAIVETGMFDRQVGKQNEDDEAIRLAAAFEAMAQKNGALGLLTRYEGRLYRSFKTLVERLETTQRNRRAEEKICQNEPDLAA